MPYKNKVDLPDSVKNVLPDHAQDIYKEAFNSAWEEYKNSSDREETAHKVAWSAVKSIYVKSQSGKWRKK